MAAGSETYPDVGESVTVNGLATNYHCMGEGHPMVLLHGSGPGVSAWSNWSGVMPRLAEFGKVFAPDIVGFGFSERPTDGNYNIKLWVNQLIGFLDAHGLERAVFVGNSFGGGLSLATALKYADRMSGMVLMGTPSGEFEQTEGLRGGWHYEPSPENMRAMLEKFPYDVSCVSDEMVEARYEISKLHGGQAAFRKLIARPKDPSDGPTIVHGVPEQALQTIEVPALVLHGREDQVIPLDIGVRTHRNLSSSDLHTFGKCGHWVQHEREDDFVALVSRFVGALS